MKWLRHLVLSAAALGGASLLGAAAAWTLALQTQATVSAPTAVAPGDIERVLQLVRTHDPRRQIPGVVRVAAADQRDVELLINHAVGRWPGMAARVQFDPGTARLQASLALPLPGPRRWANLDAALRQGAALPEVARLRVGKLPLPAWSAEPLLAWALHGRGLGPDVLLLRDVVRRVDFQHDRMVLFYAWQNDTSARMLAALVSQADQDRLRAYSDQLVELLARETVDSAVSLARLLPPMFERARQRSAAGGDAVRENRAALLTLAFYANQRGLAAIVPAARSWPSARRLTVTLAGRTDLPLHFLISAAISAEAGAPLADAVGLYKEVADSRGGSGFSFNDLAADRAGTRLGELAVRAPDRLQAQLAAGVGEHDLLPDTSDLPEFLSSQELMRRYGGVGSPGYTRLLADIEARLDSVPLLK